MPVLGLGALALAGCLIVPGGSNTPPMVKIEGPSLLHRGERQTFTALVSDGSPGAPTFDWGVSPQCPATAEAAVVSRQAGAFISGSATATISTLNDPGVCVFVVVKDSEGAMGLAVQLVTVKRLALDLEVPASITGGQPLTVTAAFAGEAAETAAATFSWGKDVTCDGAQMLAMAVAAAGQGGKGASSWHADRAPRKPFCLAVHALDEYAVETTATQMVTNIVTLAPPAAIRVVKPIAAALPYGLYTDVRLAAADPGDLDAADTLGFTWKLTRPDGSTFVPAACLDAVPAGSEVCFTVDQAGAYGVALTVVDGAEQASASSTFSVVDQPPCIRQTQPDFLNAPKSFWSFDRDRVFNVVAVDDDADPVPAGARPSQGMFVWSVRPQVTPAQVFLPAASALETYTVPARDYRPGDLIDVRVEYRDRLDRQNLKARDFSHCKDEDPLCELVPGSGCYQRVTWTVEYL